MEWCEACEQRRGTRRVVRLVGRVQESRLVCSRCEDAMSDKKTTPATPKARQPQPRRAPKRASSKGAVDETLTAEADYARDVLRRVMGLPTVSLADLVDEAQAAIKATAGLRELLVRCRPYLRWDCDGDEAILVDALAAAGIGKPAAPAGAVLELEALRAAPPAAAPPAAAPPAAAEPPVAAAQRWDLDLMGHVYVRGVVGHFADGGTFIAVDGRRWAAGAIFFARPAPEVQPQPGLIVSLLRGGRAEVVRVLNDVVLLKTGGWMELEAFQRDARPLISEEEPPFDDIPF